MIDLLHHLAAGLEVRRSDPWRLSQMQLDNPWKEIRDIGETNEASEESGFVSIEGETFYRIVDVDRMDPFLMNIVSGANHWMFAASNGALTAGRRNADHALFPYCTQDKLFESFRSVGSCTLLWVETETGSVLWEPFRSDIRGTRRRRNLFKSIDGNQVIFEETDAALGLRFRYSWMMGERFGFIRRASLENLTGVSVTVRVLDGIQNIVPYGLDQNFVGHFSNLADAYKKNELLSEEGLGIYYLSSIPTDRAEPSEGLKASVVWSTGLDRSGVLLCSRQLEAFRAGESLATEEETRGERCSYLVESSVELTGRESKEWWLAAEIEQDAAQIEGLRQALAEGKGMAAALRKDFLENRAELRAKVSASDGLQLTANRIRDARHRSNTLFNVMRGGVFNDAYQLSVADFKRYLGSWNKQLQKRYGSMQEELGSSVRRDALIEWAEGEQDPDLIRLACEYLPLSFSRRHGDPSRPWNKFSIETHDEAGNPVLAYQGNWRDIFQNWEPLGYAYPEYLTGMIFRFLNATTADGYNPYRVTRDGFDWEVLDPSEPWSNIGYWGDHQIVYLLKLLEALNKHAPQTLQELFEKECFVYADVPYRIRGFSDIWNDPRQTVVYDDEAAAELSERVARIGSDGKLLRKEGAALARANLIEKLLSPLLAKLSNFVLDGGIWMNTQRPEWNDANNALVGYGVSVVTLCYVNRYLEFLAPLIDAIPAGRTVTLDAQLAAFLGNLDGALERFEPALEREVDAATRYQLVETLGRSGEEYRNSVYAGKIGASRAQVSPSQLSSFLKRAMRFAGHAIDSNRRSDALYHSYNLLRPKGTDGVELGRLPEMLEGQVAVLSSHRLTTNEAVGLLDGLRQSRLYREDVESYLLYPDKALPRFLEKNKVAPERVEASEVLQAMLRGGDGRVLAKDANGVFRFNGSFKNAGDLEAALGALVDDYDGLKEEASVREILDLFEDTFDHRSFTGRSGTFFAYEGLGSVYWHMVSKLALAIQEQCRKAGGAEAYDALVEHYFECVKGLGFDKSPARYGAFPIDAYSHTPKHMGAQQPGMTGQVKEDILSRWGELGVLVSAGRIGFDSKLLKASEFIQSAEMFQFLNTNGEVQGVDLAAGSLAFTYCQTPFVYRLAAEPGLIVAFADGSVQQRPGLRLTAEESSDVFSRRGRVVRVEVAFRAEDCCGAR